MRCYRFVRVDRDTSSPFIAGRQMPARYVVVYRRPDWFLARAVGRDFRARTAGGEVAEATLG